MLVVYLFALCLSFAAIHAQDGNSPYCYPARVYASTEYQQRQLSDFYVDFENEYMVEDQKDSFFGTHHYVITDVKNSKRYSKRNKCEITHLNQRPEDFQCVPSSAESKAVSGHDDQMSYRFSTSFGSITIIADKKTGQPVTSTRYRTGSASGLHMTFHEMTPDIQDHYTGIYNQLKEECGNYEANPPSSGLFG